MAMEIERKFLLKHDLPRELLNLADKLVITQGYLAIDKDKVVRIRASESKKYECFNSAFLTVKSRRGNGISREEIETPIRYDKALEMLKYAEGNLIEKTRYEIPIENTNLKWEIDEFHGHNKGLWIVEIELEDEEQEFYKPSWLGEEISQDKRYANSKLSKHPWPFKEEK